METIYTLTGWVKQVIDNEHAKVLEEIRMNAAGELGKETLLKIATGNLKIWNDRYSNRKRKYAIAYMCCVYSNEVCKENGILVRDKTIFSKIIKIENKILKRETDSYKKNALSRWLIIGKLL